jgi:hypothetical protein
MNVHDGVCVYKYNLFVRRTVQYTVYLVQYVLYDIYVL